MNQAFVNIKEQQALQQIKEFLETISVDANLVESTEQFPVNILIAITKEMLSVNIMYVPIPEDHFNEIRLLQLYALVVEKQVEENKADVLVLLNELNNQLPLGSFVINEKGELGLKYICPVPRFDMLKQDPFTEMFSLYLNCLVGFKNVITHVNSGALTIADALKDITGG